MREDWPLVEPSIPLGPAGLKAGWLTGVLREAGVIDNARIARVDAEVIGEERGFTGVVARLRLNYERSGPSAPRSLVAKFPLAERSTASGYRQAQAAGGQLSQRYIERCIREVHFYRAVAPQTEIAPRALFASANLDAGRMLLLIEDLSHGEEGDALRGCNIEQARAVVEMLGRFHARWWERPELSGFDWLPRWVADPAASAERFRTQAGPFLEVYGDRVPPGVRRLIGRLQGGYAAVLRKLNGPPATMIHADLHLDNLIFMPTGQEPPVKVLDWQGVTRGCGVVDLATFIAGSLDVADRRVAEHDLLRQYHRTITASGVAGYSFDDLIAGYRRALLWQLAGTVGWLSRTGLDALDGRERDLVEAIFGRGLLFAAIEDHETYLRELI